LIWRLPWGQNRVLSNAEHLDFLTKKYAHAFQDPYPQSYLPWHGGGWEVVMWPTFNLSRKYDTALGYNITKALGTPAGTCGRS
jgi:hypothetical protein